MKLLIAEDDFTTRSVLEAMACRLGYTVKAVGDGQAALDALQASSEPTLALLDWNMPGLDGLEVCRNIRLYEERRPCYMILLTANDEKQAVVEALQAGANDFVRKPYELEELQARLTVGARVLEMKTRLHAANRRLAALPQEPGNCSACPGRRFRDALAKSHAGRRAKGGK